MAAHVSFDTSDARALAADFGAIPARVAPAVAKVLNRGAMNVKAAMRKDLYRSTHFKGKTAESVDYDVEVAADSLSAEIGPKINPDGRGGVAGIAYGTGSFAGGARGGNSVRDPIHALEDETPAFMREMELVAVRLLGRA